MKKLTIFALIGMVLILSGCTSQNAKLDKNKNQPTVKKNVTNNLNTNKVVNTNTNQVIDPFADWQNYKNEATGYSYKCPPTWRLTTNRNYGSQVIYSECVKIYSGELSFDDGISIKFGFVPTAVAENYQIASQNWADTLINNVKNETNAQAYSNNKFIGWISIKKEHPLNLIARYQVSGGYYEVLANAMGETKTSTEFKQLADEILSTFELQ